VSETVSVEVARYRERDMLGEALAARGYAATPVEETGRLGFDVECGDDAKVTCDGLLHELELLLSDLKTPFIPIRGDGFVFLRPPGD
jgi:hypothetical protein